MHRLTFFVAVVLSVVLVMRQPVTSDPFAAYEQARVRAHFDSAEREVRSNPVMGLSTAQRIARAQALDRVHAYAARGVFPKNRDFPGFVPYFVDRLTGTRCGMAFLIEESGDAGFVARVAATNNNASIPDLKDDPEMLAWLDRNGLTLDEAARIQPKYEPVPVPKPEASAGYRVATGVSVGADVVAVALNARATSLSPALTGALGVATGVVGVMIGMPNVAESGSRRTLGFLNAGAGAISVAFGVHRLAQKRSTASRVSVAPWFSASGASGLSGRITF